MCGIAGLHALDGRPVAPPRLQAMMDALAHRGPDGSGRFADGAVALGHRRLSIIDLDGGAQPQANEDDTVHVVFNGEIYNFVELREELRAAGHAFRTRSDTEVIVHAWEEWGPQCVHRFNGMFAFALWDAPRRRLFIARDPLGIKPLYWTVVDGQLLFASEIKALLTVPGCPRRVDLAALNQLFTLSYVPSPRTLFDGIHKLPPGHWLQVEGAAFAVERYAGAAPVHRRDGSLADRVEEYADLALNAVRRQLRSDVPVGLFLSSGVDSAALLAMMRHEQDGPLHTFTIGFEGGEGSNENDDARAIAERFGARHEERIVTAADYADYFGRYMDDLEEPVGNESAAAFHFVSQLASRQVKVVLTGQGADEPWAGYHRHLGMALSEHYRRLPALLTQGLFPRAAALLPRNARLKRGVRALAEPDLAARLALVYAFFSPELRERLFLDALRANADFRAGAAPFALARLQQDVSHLDPLSQMLYVDTRASLPDDLLMVNDKMSMAHSIEARVPYLDLPLLAFVESLPPHCKLQGLHGKFLHKKALERWLPRTVVHRRKKGFDNPVTHWLRGPLRPLVQELLFSADAAVRRYFDMDVLTRLVAQHDSGREDHMRQIYLLLSFEMWHRRFIGRG